MEDIIVIGAGGLGKEVIWLIERINKEEHIWNILGFVDDDVDLENVQMNVYQVLGTTSWLKNYPEEVHVVCAIAKPSIRKKIVNGLMCNKNIKFASLVDPAAIVSDLVTIGVGSIICAGAVLTVNIDLGNHVIVDVNCTVGHDSRLGDFVMMYPNSNVSGNVLIGKGIEIGTGAQVIQRIEVKEDIVIGAGAVVVKNLMEPGVYIGVPATNRKHGTEL